MKLTFLAIVLLPASLLPSAAAETHFYQEHGVGYPFFLNFIAGPYLTAGDLNGDGKLDLLTAEDGSNYGGSPGKRLVAWFNTGTAASPAFTPDAFTYGSQLPGLFDVSPVLVDLDGDGDLDIIGGSDDGTFRYFQRSGPAATGTFTELTGTGNPLNGITLSGLPEPAVVDLDGDGDKDVVVEDEATRRLVLLRNTGTPTAPAFSRQVFAPFSAIVADYGPGFADTDGDGDRDLFVTSASNPDRMQFYRNTGTIMAPVFTLDAAPLSAVSGSGIRGSHPVLADFNADGDIDLFAGLSEGGPVPYLSGAVPPPARFAEETSSAYPFPAETFLGNFTSGDLDGDGDQDLIAQTPEFTMVALRNTGTATAPAWSPWVGSSPLATVASGSYRPELVDVDRDGDLDLFTLAASDQFWQFYRNTGTATAPVFSQQNGAANPLGFVSSDATGLAFADPDGDGDLDILASHTSPTSFSEMRYYRNEGSATIPVWAQAYGSQNPFENVLFDFAEPALADLDGDGDLDLVVGGRGKLVYWQNRGTRTAPDFVQVTAPDSPFAQIGGLGFSRVVPLIGEWKSGGAADLLLWHYDDFITPAEIRFFSGLGSSTPGGYTSWQAANFTLPAETALAAAGEDPDKDGVVNLIEYALKTSPKIPGRYPGTLTRTAGGALQLTFDARDDDPALTGVGQSGSSPASLAGSLPPAITDPVPGDGLKRWTFTDQPPVGANPRRFLRAKFSLSP